MAVALRPGKTPSDVEIRAHLRRLVRRVRTRWHKPHITLRGNGHYARPEAMNWCEDNGIDYIFGLSGIKPLTSLAVGSAEWVYDSLYCARGQAENLIKLHKTQLASDRTSCRSAIANQVRLVLHTAAYWLMLTVRDAIPKTRELATAEFATLRLRPLKIAARVVETARRIRLTFAAACPDAYLIHSLPAALLPLGP